MSIWGKIIGGVAGFALGGPLGALIGAVAGHAVDKIRAELPEGDVRTTAKQMAFTVAVIALAAKMAKADGTVSRAEINAFKEVFHVPPEEVGNVARIFDAAKRDAQGFEPYARQIAEMFRHDPQVLEELLGGLFHIAKADGAVHPQELAFLRRVAQIFGFGDRVFERVRAVHVGEGRADPYEVLGIGRHASDDEVKRRYRTLVRENHPDALMAKGMPKEFVDVATQKVAAINDAYDQVEKERGLK